MPIEEYAVNDRIVHIWSYFYVDEDFLTVLSLQIDIVKLVHMDGKLISSYIVNIMQILI